MRKQDLLLHVREPSLRPWMDLAVLLLQDMLAKTRTVTVYLEDWWHRQTELVV